MLVLLISLLAYCIPKVVLKNAYKEENKKAFDEWYNDEYIPSSYTATVNDIIKINSRLIQLKIEDTANFFSYSLDANSNDELLNRIKIGDTIVKETGKETIWLVKGNKKTRFNLVFKHTQ